MLKTVQFHLYTNSIDCWFQYEGGAMTSFDPAQLPAALAALLPETLTAALAAKVTAEAQAAALRAENEAKNANIQELLAKVADLEAKASPDFVANEGAVIP